MKFTLIRLAVMLSSFITLSACLDARPDSSDKKQAKATEAMIKEANNAVGMPGIVNFTEKRFAKEIYELRDQAVTTYTYTVALDGTKVFLCESIGYGLPYAVQYVSPTKVGYKSMESGLSSVPQAEPNGLFMPDSLSATWIQCVHKGKVKVVYVEPEILVSPFKL